MQLDDASPSFPRPVLIHRQVTLSLSAFDRLKAWQRHWQRTQGRLLTNGEVLDRLLLASPLPEVADVAY